MALDMAKVLNEAADLIEDGKRWTQGRYKQYFNDKGERTEAPCYCAMGAIFCVSGSERIFDKPGTDVIDVLGEDVERIIQYNDRKNRRPQTMAKYLRNLAKKYKV